MGLLSGDVICRDNVMIQILHQAGMIAIGMANAMCHILIRMKQLHALQIYIPQIQITTMTFTDGLNVIRVVYLHAKIPVVNSKIVICKTNAVELLTLVGMIVTGLVKAVKKTQQNLKNGFLVSSTTQLSPLKCVVT